MTSPASNESRLGMNGHNSPDIVPGNIAPSTLDELSPFSRQHFSHRSCTECCRRKIRCDHRLPCSNCLKANSECTFPTSRRPPTRTKNTRSRNDEVLQHLKRLEDRLTARKIEEQACSPNTNNDGQSPGVAVPKGEETARLVLDRDRSRYISNNFWRNMAREIEEMRDLLDNSPPESEVDDTQAAGDENPASDMTAQHSSFVLRPFFLDKSLNSFHPSPPYLLAMFDIFQDNIDPIVRVFHRLTLRATVHSALAHINNLDKSTNLTLFTLYYAALTSNKDSDCKDMFREERSVLLVRYRFAIEQSLAQAHFLQSPNFTILSCLVLFLVCVRRHDNSLFVSNFLGLIIRIAQSMGLHRDGQNFGLTPFQVEMRRRVWWQICVLDIRAC
ncbi:hypothetical protein F4805DRAFT_334346 [Annulohypoxylon moriforme]|nr:hypothetical protein F4805DRAFT_334346 [Annulohypoxylon moriforme]